MRNLLIWLTCALSACEASVAKHASSPSSQDASVGVARGSLYERAMPSPMLAPDASDASDASAAELQPDVVGTTRVEIAVSARRTLPVQLWYPAQAGPDNQVESGAKVSQLEPEGERRQLLERLLDDAPEGCTSQRVQAVIDAPARPSATPYPLLVYSHHLEGMRYALFSLAEALAQHGFVVAAPDHVGRTLFDRKDDLQRADLLGTLWRFGLDDLSVRADDMTGVLDVLLDSEAATIPEGLRGSLDDQRIGIFGHSMGSMTAGVVAARDARIRAAAFLAFPPAQVLPPLDLLGQPTVDVFQVPALFMLNQEDAPLSAVSGLESMREQFEAYPAAAYLVEVSDTGHWSFADDCGLIPDFMDGCGEGTRHANPYEHFAFLDNREARNIAAEYLVEFFSEQLLASPDGVLQGPVLPHTLVKAHPAR